MAVSSFTPPTRVSAEDIGAMAEYLSDALIGGSSDDLPWRTDAAILDAVQDTYPGGVLAFLADADA